MDAPGRAALGSESSGRGGNLRCVACWFETPRFTRLSRTFYLKFCPFVIFSSLEIHPSCLLGTVFLMKTYPPLITWEIKRERCEHKPGVFAGAAGGRLHAAWAGLWVTAPPALGVASLPGELHHLQGSPGRLPYLPALYTPPCGFPDTQDRSLFSSNPQHRRPASAPACLSSISGS